MIASVWTTVTSLKTMLILRFRLSIMKRNEYINISFKTIVSFSFVIKREEDKGERPLIANKMNTIFLYF
jgi:hypothetical protein